SSGHLIILAWLFKEKISLGFVVFLHSGTFFALLLYFAKDWLKLIKNGLLVLKDKNFTELPEGKTFWLILLTTIPGAILGKMGEVKVEKLFYHPLTVAFNLGGFALLFYGIDRFSKKNRTLKELNAFHALFIGFAQALAIIPGISRSAITMASGRLLGLDRGDSVRFSFLISAPIILGAVLLKNQEMREGLVSPYLISNGLAFISSFLSGFLAIHFLTRFIVHHSFNLFIIYRLLISLLIIGIILL
ncbi:MAG: undecaprenyl-diphosphate phosphatase, partial [Candidatus Omnitrophica bacterium]|nr:undecaprenyl-diphosphate phosphatase [Candidatus Omnitrophota bacterium]